ncbi:MAG: ATP-dependent DNA helicase RecG [Clostridia bacterium]|nr:ATP-dependent DNA helicase RecG [Clostridia bacterium]
MEKALKKISDLRGVGESRRKAFERAGVSTLYDLVRYYPRAYQNRGNTKTLLEIKECLINDEGNKPFSCILTVATEPRVHLIRRGMTLVKFRAFDEFGTCEVIFFNQNFLKDVFHAGSTFRFWGKFTFIRNSLSLASPLYEPCINDGRELPPIVPVYPLTSPLTQKIVSSAVSEALKEIIPEFEEMLPCDILKDASLPTIGYALRNIHHPESEAALELAMKRLVFDELFVTSVALALSGGKKRVPSSTQIRNIDIKRFTDNLPYSFTGAQKRSVNEIISDMTSPFAMNRILTGDVGSGKTVVAATGAYVCLNNGYDCLFMVPTEILARQHFNDLEPMLSRFGFTVHLLTGNISTSKRRVITEDLADPSKPTLVIGTQALLSPDVTPSSPGLVIIDEQHRFGAMQRASLADKAKGAGTLVMSATPIPRTLSLVVCGTLDVSKIDELPAGRQSVDTFVVSEDYRPRLNGFIKKQVDNGHQVYIVCPSIEEIEQSEKVNYDAEEYSDLTLFDVPYEEQLPLKAAETYAEELKLQLPMLRIAVAHGRMKAQEREDVMAAFCAGRIDVLVSTTVIEVGVNVPNATLMIVENAERFGLSQLHQLRGRVGRGSAKSYFVLVSNTKSEKSRERLLTVKKCRNGYDIAEEDLKQRGPGDLFAENGVMRQHGRSQLVLASKCTDTNLFALANDMALRVLTDDPTLAKDKHSLIRNAAERFIAKSESTLN